MLLYAQVENDVVVGISQLSGQVEAANLIEITNLDEKPNVGFVFDPATGRFSEPKAETIVLQPTIEEQILIENQYQTALLEMNMMGVM